jgi:hypothetical protein
VSSVSCTLNGLLKSAALALVGKGMIELHTRARSTAAAAGVKVRGSRQCRAVTCTHACS